MGLTVFASMTDQALEQLITKVNPIQDWEEEKNSPTSFSPVTSTKVGICHTVVKFQGHT